jgi:hypothetical protein
MTYFTNFSFLAPEGITREAHSPLAPEVGEQLQLSLLFAHDPMPCFTADPEVIAYRQGLFRDMDDHPALIALIGELREQIGILEDLCRSEDATSDNETCVRDLVLLTVYTRLIKKTHERLAEIPAKSACVKRLGDILTRITADIDFTALTDRLERISVDIEQIKSVTVGINLDAQLRPHEAGVLAIHSEYFKSGEWIDKLLRLEFAHKDFNCIAPLTPLSKKLTAQEQQLLQNALNGALNKMMGQSLRRARGNSVRTLRVWCRDLLPLLPELIFLADARRLIAAWHEAGARVCYPTLRKDGTTSLRGLYNPHLLRTLRADQIVPNSFAADRTRRAFLLTGPNSGGKTVYTVAVAICYLCAGLGMPIPAAEGEITPAANIMTHFPGVNSNQYRIGRLEEECRHLAELKQALIPGTVLFMDETFSSTGAEEATALAEKYLDTLLRADCLCLFSTHLHDLARRCADKTGYVTLSARPNSYRIAPERPGGSSYAEQIARSYGLD